MVFQLDCLVLRSAKSILSGSMLGKQIVSRAACRLLESRAEGITQTGIVVGTVEAPRRERAVGHAEETHGDRRAADVVKALSYVSENVLKTFCPPSASVTPAASVRETSRSTIGLPPKTGAASHHPIRRGKGLRPDRPPEMFAASEGPMESGFLVFQDVPPDHSIRVAPKCELGDVPLGRLLCETNPQSLSSRHDPFHVHDAIRLDL